VLEYFLLQGAGFPSYATSDVARRGKWGVSTLGTGFGEASTHFAENKIVFLSRNLDQNMLKSGLFFRKKVYKRPKR